MPTEERDFESGLDDDLAPPSELRGSPSWLDVPPSGKVSPPVSTRVQVLPVPELDWDDFERLCLRLARTESDIEQCHLYGKRGQRQHGIDFYARLKRDGSHRVYQCKRVADLNRGRIRAAVASFLEGAWVSLADTLVLCTSDDLSDIHKSEEFVRQAAILSTNSKRLLLWDRNELSHLLKAHPRIVDDFFGRSWVKEFCGAEITESLGTRLDSQGVAEFRRRCRTFYRQVFRQHDPGLPIPVTSQQQQLPLDLYDRFVVPDVVHGRVVAAPTSSMQSAVLTQPEEDGPPEEATGYAQDGFPLEVTSIREAAPSWLAGSSKCVLLGGAGVGKSTLLRFIALDLLSDAPRMGEVATQWASCLPIWVPFALWTQMISSTGGDSPSVSDVVRQWLHSWGEDRLWDLFGKALDDERVLLLVDGLDEWSSVEAARLAADRLAVFLGQRSIPAVISSRQLGFSHLGIQTAGWRVGTLATLSETQQRDIAAIWFAHSAMLLGHVSDETEAQRRGDVEAERFMEELASATDLQELACIPLLLVLFIYLRLHDIVLPLNRFKAYSDLLTHLLATHPERRRRAAAVAGGSARQLTDDEVKRAMAFVAFQTQQVASQGVLEECAVIEMFEDFARNGENGLGMATREAKAAARELLDVGERICGLLVRPAKEAVSFLHRTLQEFLAGEWIAQLPLDVQLEVFSIRCVDVQWQEPLLAALHLTRRADEAKRIVETMGTSGSDLRERLQVEALLATIVFGEFNLPATYAANLAHRMLARIEEGEWLPQRERLLSASLHALRTGRGRDLVATRMRSWFPARFAWTRRGTITELSQWAPNDSLKQGLRRATNDEDYEVQRAAADALARVDGTSSDPSEILWELAHESFSLRRREVATRAMYSRWPAATRELLELADASVAPGLKILAIRGRVDEFAANDEDYRFLIKCIERGTWLRWLPLRIEAVSLLERGWSNDPTLRELCLHSLHDDGRRDFTIDFESAFELLVRAFEPSDDIARSLAKAIGDRGHFRVEPIHAEAIASKYMGQADFEALVDRLLVKAPNRLDFAQLAALRPTNSVRDQLVAQTRGSFPYWPAKVLLDVWGIGDPVARTAVESVLFGPTGSASLIAEEAQRIVPDAQRCEARLFELLRDDKCSDPDRVARGLLRLYDGRLPPVAVVEILGLLRSPSKGAINNRSGLSAALIEGAPQDPQVRDLAFREELERDGALVAVARSYKDDEALGQMLLRAIGPLPAFLRERLVETAGKQAIASDAFDELLKLYPAEHDASVKTRAVIAYVNAVSERQPLEEDVPQRIAADVVSYGFDHEARRQAALAGLVCLRKLELFQGAVEPINGEPAKVSVRAVETENVPLAGVLARHWSYVSDTFGADLNVRIEADYGRVDLSESLAPFAAESDVLQNRLLTILEEQAEKPLREGLLRFLARMRPKSRVLKRFCFATLSGSDRSDSGVRAAAELLGANFGGDSETREELLTLCPEHDVLTPGVALAFIEGWPDDPLLLSFVEQARREEYRGLIFYEFYPIYIAACSADELGNFLAQLFRADPQFGFPFWRLAVKPLIMRLSRDKVAFQRVKQRLASSTLPSELVSLPRILAASHGVDADLREWISVHQAGSSDALNVVFGNDIVAGEARALPYSLLDSLVGADGN